MTASAQYKPDAQDIAAIRRALIANGYRYVPAKGKGPIIKGWPNFPQRLEHVDDYLRTRADHTNTGILTGEIVAIDIDAQDAEIAEKLTARLMEIPCAERAPYRVGKAPKSLFIFLATETRRKVATGEYLVGGAKCQVEVLGNGQQFVAYGNHAETGLPYVWSNGDPLSVPLRDLPEITPEAVDAFLADAEAILATAGTPSKPKHAARVAQTVGGTFWKQVNTAALADTDRWVQSLFSTARKEAGTGAWRVTSEDLGRSLEEDISIHGDGIQDFGTEQPTTAIQLVMEFGGAANPTMAAHWLCERLGRDPADFGWETRQPAAPRISFNARPHIVADNDNDAEDAVAEATLDANTIPEADCYPPGAVGKFARWITSCSRFPSPHLSLVSALATTAVLAGRRYKGPTGLRSNLYAVALAESGFGKDISIRAEDAILATATDGEKVAEALLADKLRSLPGLAGRLRKFPVALGVVDEFGKWLAELTGRNAATHSKEILTALMELTGAPFGTWGGAEKAEGNLSRVVQPCLVLHGVSTPSTFWEALGSGNISEGLLGRLLVIDAGTTPPKKVRRPAGSIDNPPAEFGEMVDKLLGWQGSGRFGPGAFYALSANSKNKPWPMVTATYADGVEDVFEGFDDRMRALKVDPQYRPIRSRVGEHAARLALIVAVGCAPEEPVITREIQEWANRIAEASFQAILRGAHDNVADNEKGREYLRIKRMVDAAKSEGLALGVITRRVKGSLDRNRLNDVLAQLEEAGEVVLAEQPGDRGQTRTRYWSRAHLPKDAKPCAKL